VKQLPYRTILGDPILGAINLKPSFKAVIYRKFDLRHPQSVPIYASVLPPSVAPKMGALKST